MQGDKNKPKHNLLSLSLFPPVMHTQKRRLTHHSSQCPPVKTTELHLTFSGQLKHQMHDFQLLLFFHLSRFKEPTSFIFNPREKNKKKRFVCLDSAVLCVPKEMSTQNIALQMTLSLLQHLAVQHRLKCYMSY